GRLHVERYWSVRYEASGARSLAENAERLDAALREAVEVRLVADVPVGAFLSGGLDSSLVVALMQRASGEPVRTFSIGFEESSFNELEPARRVARFLGTRHREHVVRYDVRDLLPELVAHFGEPFADSSAIPTYQLSRLTRQEVTVALSGDGGDEVFGGYRRYQARVLAEVYNRWPPLLGRGLAERLIRRLGDPATYYGSSLRKKTRRFAEFAAAVRDEPRTSWAFFFGEAEKTSLYTSDFADSLECGTDLPTLGPYLEQQAHCPGQQMLWLDLMTYLPDDILAKVDRMSMACSLETRAPLLDHHVVELMAGVPRQHKLGLGSSKRLLRAVARRYLPSWVLERPKQGFAVPLAAWLQRGLRPWMEDLLLGPSLRQRGYFRPQEVARLVGAHLSGQWDCSQQLWALMVLEEWARQESSAPRAVAVGG
ncbi:MAG: asparagine synthase C-terminal domain-containing protein, partial [Candidatus Latescibacterota bacterium]